MQAPETQETNSPELSTPNEVCDHEAYGRANRVPTVALTIHPALKDMPEWDNDDPQFESFCRDIHKRGIDQPILIDSKLRVVDGRHRLRAAKRLQLVSVPTRMVPDKDIPSLVVHYIIQRRHYGKGALAFMCAPLILDGAPDKSVDLIASEFGFSRQLLQQAKQLHEIFKKDGGEEFRAEMEPKILAGEVGLGAVLAGWAGRQASLGKAKPITTQLDLWDRSFNDLQKRFSTWDKFDIEAKSTVTARLSGLVEAMPDELLAKLTAKLRQEAKRRADEKESLA